MYAEPVFQEAPPVHIAADGTRTEGWVEAKAARDAEMASLGRVAANVEHNPSPYVRFQDRLDQAHVTEGLSEALNAIAGAWGTINNLKNAYTGFTDGVLDGLLYDILIPAVSGVTDAIYGSLGYFVTGGTGFREENRRTGEGIFSLAKKIATLEISEDFAQWLNITLSKFQYAKTPKELGRALVNLIEVATVIFGNELSLMRVGGKVRKNPLTKKDVKHGGTESRNKKPEKNKSKQIDNNIESRLKPGEVAVLRKICTDDEILEMITSSRLPAKGGELSHAGRGLQKHGWREGSIFPKVQGSPKSFNEMGDLFIKEILNNPSATISINHRKGIDIHIPNSIGVRFTLDGDFIGFIEPKRK